MPIFQSVWRASSGFVARRGKIPSSSLDLRSVGYRSLVTLVLFEWPSLQPMEIDRESALESAERRARESSQLADEAKRGQEADEEREAGAAAQAATDLIVECLDRLAQAGRADAVEIAALESVTEKVGLLRKRQERRRFVHREVWTAPVGVGWKTGTAIGAVRNPRWMRVFPDSQLAIGRDGTIWHGAFSTEKNHRSWSKLDLPSTEAEVEALTEALGAILAKYVQT